MERAPRVAVCVITHRRPEMLRSLLRALAAQTFADAAPHMVVIVVDNDAAGSAAAVAAEPRGGPPPRYAVEPRRGIPFARNRAVREAAACGCELVAFIDDDELPARDWLDRLLRAMRDFSADAVQGRVVVEGEDPDAWEGLRLSSFFHMPYSTTGRRLATAATNNVLARRELFEAVGGFHEPWAFCGGTDTLLFRKAALAGFRLIWCQEAVTTERAGDGRTSRWWLARRAFRTGVTRAHVRMLIAGGPGEALLQFGQGLRLASGAAARLLLWPLAEVPPSLALRRLLVGAGMTWAALGMRYDEYSR